jgi:hypothetical protein
MLQFQSNEAYKVSLDDCNNLKKNNLKNYVCYTHSFINYKH